MPALTQGDIVRPLHSLSSIWSWLQQNSSDPFLSATTATLAIFTLLLVAATLYLAAGAINASRPSEKHPPRNLNASSHSSGAMAA